MQGDTTTVTHRRVGRAGAPSIDAEGFVVAEALDEACVEVGLHVATVQEVARAATLGLSVSLVARWPLEVAVERQDRVVVPDTAAYPLPGLYNVASVRPNLIDQRVLLTRVEP